VLIDDGMRGGSSIKVTAETAEALRLAREALVAEKEHADEKIPGVE